LLWARTTSNRLNHYVLVVRTLLTKRLGENKNQDSRDLILFSDGWDMYIHFPDPCFQLPIYHDHSRDWNEDMFNSQFLLSIRIWEQCLPMMNKSPMPETYTTDTQACLQQWVEHSLSHDENSTIDKLLELNSPDVIVSSNSFISYTLRQNESEKIEKLYSDVLFRLNEGKWMSGFFFRLHWCDDFLCPA